MRISTSQATGELRAKLFALILAVGVFSATGDAKAQQSVGPLLNSDIPSDADRGGNVSVLDRARPAFEAQGIRAGEMLLFPKVELGVGLLDNVYGSSIEPKSDGSVYFNPSVAARSDWKRHALNVSANAQFQRFLTYPRENQSGWGAAVDGRLDVGDHQIFASADVSRSFEARYAEGAPDNVSRPVPIVEADAKIRAAYQGIRMRGTLAGSYTHINYEDVPSLLGGTQDQDYRDRHIARIAGRIEYGVTPGTAVFAQLGYARIDYAKIATPSQDRSANDVRILGGVSLDLSAVVRGTIALGYVRRSFDQARFPLISGLAADVRLEYFVTQLTTVTLNGRRFVEDSAAPGAGGYFNNNVTLRADHELLRNLLLFAEGSYERDIFHGADRRDDVYAIRGGARYLMTPKMELGFRLGHTRRDSAGRLAVRDMSETRALLSITFKL